MAIQGVRLTTNFVTDQRPKDWREGILLLFPNGSAPLFALTVGMKKKVAEDPDFNWWEKIMSSQRVVLTAAVTASESSLTVAAGVGRAQGIRAGSVLRSEESNELLYVDADPIASGTTISVSRGWGGTTATAVDVSTTNVNANFVVVGNATEENSNAPTAVNFDPDKRTNYTQIFRDTLAMSRTAQKTRLRTGDAVREAKRETLELHSAGIEKALWFGRGLETGQTINGNVARSTYGILHWLTEKANAENIIDATTGLDRDGGSTALDGTTLGWDDMEAFLEIAFRFGSQEKMGFCGNDALLKINQAARLATNTSVNLQVGQKEFGMNVSKLTTPFGTLVLKGHPLFNQMTGGSSPDSGTFLGMNSWLYVLDMNELVYRFLRDSDTQFESKLQANDLDGMQSGYLTECGLEIHHPNSHAILKNIPAASAG